MTRIDYLHRMSRKVAPPLIVFLLSCNLLRLHSANAEPYESRDHSLSPPYASGEFRLSSVDHCSIVCSSIVLSLSESHWRLKGHAIATDRYIRLTHDSQNQSGAIWSNHPVTYPDWEVQIQFKIHGSRNDFFGDGLAFWYVREPMSSGE
jgi:hypothetical protein